MSMATIKAYYEAFNQGDLDGMLACLHAEFAHHVNEGAVRLGREAFADFCRHMSETYSEQLTDIVIFASEDGRRGAAEFVVNGTYLKTDPGLPEARGQTYILNAGGFFTLKDGKITRVTTYYNLSDWIRQVS
ncbi:MAG: nuclear transport factor 2 family protein [Rhodobacteraceae bacterium]|nr:nuclear transport factor 2 family protein [Paracoccaceae bacterium]